MIRKKMEDIMIFFVPTPISTGLDKILSRDRIKVDVVQTYDHIQKFKFFLNLDKFQTLT
jgi:hypothetical protein